MNMELLLFLFACAWYGADTGWPEFRGASGSGVVEDLSLSLSFTRARSLAQMGAVGTPVPLAKRCSRGVFFSGLFYTQMNLKYRAQGRAMKNPRRDLASLLFWREQAMATCFSFFFPYGYPTKSVEDWRWQAMACPHCLFIRKFARSFCTTINFDT